MSASPPLKRIPIPLSERWRDVRTRVLPVLMFVAVVAVIGVLWKENIAAPNLVGQAEPLQANVSCYKPGMLAHLDVIRFQRVKAGDAVGQVLVTDPKILASSLSVIEAEIDALRAGMQPLTAQQKTAMDYGRLRLDWMRQRAQLAMAKVNLQLAASEFHRTGELFKDKIVSEKVFEQAKASEQRLQSEVDELSQLVEEQAKDFDENSLTNTFEMSKLTDAPLRAAIAVQESKLRLTEAELSPITLRATADGMVSVLYHRTGEAITAGEPIFSIAAFNSVRIIGYLRAPIMEEPRVGSKVQVRTRGLGREAGVASILEVGTQMETIAPALLGPMKFAATELGLPISISVPPNLKIKPGELVDLTLATD
jgi:multidrug resistance efflux pump